MCTPRLHISTTVRRPGHTTPLASSLFDDLCTVVQSRRPLTDELTSASYPPSEATWPGTRSRWVLSSHSFRPPLACYTNFSVPATLWIGCSPDAIQFFLVCLVLQCGAAHSFCFCSSLFSCFAAHSFFFWKSFAVHSVRKRREHRCSFEVCFVVYGKRREKRVVRMDGHFV
ncbi:hypothetical protein VPH35_122860 [Triticum aestivum]